MFLYQYLEDVLSITIFVKRLDRFHRPTEEILTFWFSCHLFTIND